MKDLGLRVAAFLAFAALLGGATWAAYEFLAVEGAAVGALPGPYAVAPGRSFTVPFTLVNEGTTEAAFRVAVVDDAGLGLAGDPATLRVAPFARAGGWLTLAVPAGVTPGPYRLEIAAGAPEGAPSASTIVDLQVLAPGPGLQDGEAAAVRYVGRYENGVVFDTNVRDVAYGPWPKAQDFRPHDTWEPFQVTVGPLSEVVRGFADALESMQAGETRTVTLPPGQAYGNATLEDRIPREVEIQRNYTVQIQDVAIPRGRFAQHLEATGQGAAEAYRVGDTFQISDGRNTFRARLTAIEEDVVRYRFQLAPGERYSRYPFWPGGSVVTHVNETAATFHTTPTSGPEDRFTYFDPWENLTRVASVDAERIVLRHEVEPGFTYTYQPARGAPATPYRVVSADEEWIVVETANPHRLAGRTLVFDITVEALVTPPATG